MSRRARREHYRAKLDVLGGEKLVRALVEAFDSLRAVHAPDELTTSELIGLVRSDPERFGSLRAVLADLGCSEPRDARRLGHLLARALGRFTASGRIERKPVGGMTRWRVSPPAVIPTVESAPASAPIAEDDLRLAADRLDAAASAERVAAWASLVLRREARCLMVEPGGSRLCVVDTAGRLDGQAETAERIATAARSAGWPVLATGWRVAADGSATVSILAADRSAVGGVASAVRSVAELTLAV